MDIFITILFAAVFVLGLLGMLLSMRGSSRVQWYLKFLRPKESCAKDSCSKSEAGNVFIAIFGAIAMVGILSASVMTFMKGPLATSVKLTKVNTAETQMTVGAQVAVMATTSQANNGDCDADGFVEPMPWRAAGGAPAPTGGGLVPLSVGINKKDPWGTEYGYCAWNHGPSIAPAGTCTANLLAGTFTGEHPVVAIISAGPDKLFTTTCRTFDDADVDNDGALTSASDRPMVVKAADTDDDVITVYTYTEATAASGGLWNIKAGDPSTAQINKKIETTGAASLQGGVLLPDKALITCDATTAGLMAKNATNTGIEICDGTSWKPVSGGGAGATSSMTATLASAVGSFTELGDFGSQAASGGASLLEVSTLEVDGAGSQSNVKRFVIPLNAIDWQATGWQEVMPLHSTGPRNGEFALDVGLAAGGKGVLGKLRLRRTALANAESTVQVTVTTYAATPFTVAQTSGVGATVTGLFRQAPLTQVAGRVGIGMNSPAWPLHATLQMPSSSATPGSFAAFLNILPSNGAWAQTGLNVNLNAGSVGGYGSNALAATNNMSGGGPQIANTYQALAGIIGNVSNCNTANGVCTGVMGSSRNTGTNGVGVGVSGWNANSNPNAIGVAGIAIGGTNRNYGGYFGLSVMTPSDLPATSAALVADAGTSTRDIFYARANSNIAMAVTANGNVGIGTTTPGNRLEVRAPNGQGIGAVNATNGNGVMLTTNTADGDAQAYVQNIGGGGGLRIQSSQRLYYRANGGAWGNTHVFQASNPITQGGGANFIEGGATWSPSSGAGPFSLLNFNGTISQTGSSSGSYTGLNININEASVLGTNNFLMNIQRNGVSRFAVTPTGTALNGNLFEYATSFTAAFPQGSFTEFAEFTSYNGSLNIQVRIMQSNVHHISEHYEVAANYDIGNSPQGTVYRLLPKTGTGPRILATTGYASGEFALELVRQATPDTWRLRYRQVGATDMTGSVVFIASVSILGRSALMLDNPGNDFSSFNYPILPGAQLTANIWGVGIYRSVPQATLDVNGFARLRPYSGAPVGCGASNNGAIALTSRSTLCVCRGSLPGWVSSNDGTTTCVW